MELKSAKKAWWFLRLASGGHRWFGIGFSGERQSGHALVAPAEGPFHPLPANFQRALASEPMRIDPPALALFDNFRALGDSRQRRAGPHQAQPLQRLRRTEQGRFKREAIRLIIQAGLFN